LVSPAFSKEAKHEYRHYAASARQGPVLIWLPSGKPDENPIVEPIGMHGMASYDRQALEIKAPLSILRKASVAGIALILSFAVALAALLLTIPSVQNAALLTRAQAREHEIPYPGPRPPSRFVKALVATEDHRFYSPLDPGVDPFAVARAVIAALTFQPRDPGGSTIAQQLAKMLYTPGRQGFAVKLERVGLAIKLHFKYSPAKILAMYAEAAYFGEGYYGLAAASCGYFGYLPGELTWSQAAMLAGVVNAPTADNPRKHPHRARLREAHVLRRLVAVGRLTEEQARAALSEPLEIVERNPEERQVCESARFIDPLSGRSGKTAGNPIASLGRTSNPSPLVPRT
jgi:hypothetical protein